MKTLESKVRIELTERQYTFLLWALGLATGYCQRNDAPGTADKVHALFTAISENAKRDDDAK